MSKKGKRSNKKEAKNKRPMNSEDLVKKNLQKPRSRYQFKLLGIKPPDNLSAARESDLGHNRHVRGSVDAVEVAEVPRNMPIGVKRGRVNSVTGKLGPPTTIYSSGL